MHKKHDGSAAQRRVCLQFRPCSIKALYYSSFVVSLLMIPGLAACGDPAPNIEKHPWVAGRAAEYPLFFNPSFPPIEYASGNGAFIGLGADVIALLEAQLGVTFEKHLCADWNHHLAALRSGDCAIAPTIARTEERKSYVLFTEPYLSVPVVIITKNSWKGQVTLDDLQGRRIGVVSGYATEPYLRKQAQGRFEIVVTPTVQQGLRDVSFGEVDAFIENLAVASYHIERDAIPNLRVAGSTDYTFELSIGVSHHYPELFRAIQNGLDAIPKSDLEHLRKRWIHLEAAPGLSPEFIRLLILSGCFVCLLVIALLFISFILKRRLNEKVARLKTAQDELVTQSQRLSLATESIHAGVWEYHPRQDDFYASDSWYTMLGYAPDAFEASRQAWRDLVHPEDRPAVIRSIRAFENQLKHDTLTAEVRMKAADGKWRWVLSKGRIIERDDQHKPSRIVGLNIDISDLKKTQRQLAQSEARLRAIFDHAPYAITINDLESGRYLEANQAFLERREITREELLHSNPTEIRAVPVDPVEDIFENLKKDGVVMNREARIISKEGEERRLLFSSVLMEVEGEQQVLSMTVDVTERMRMEEALRKREETFRALSENSRDIIMRFDRGLHHTYVNAAVERATGMTPETMIGKTHEELHFPAPLVSLWEKALTQVFESSAVHQIEFQLPNGIWFDWLLMPEFDENHQVDAVITSARDITERKEAEAERAHLQRQLLQSQKMEAVGTLAGGVAHDFNNMLGAIIGYTELILADTDPGSPHHEHLQDILDVAQRSANLTRQLLAFARKQTVAPRIIDLNQAVQGMLKMLQRLIGENIKLLWIPGNLEQQVRMDPSQLDQLLANLCVNARDAIQDIGEISIRTAAIQLDQAFCAMRPECAPGDYLLIEVQDSGGGMDEETLTHAFEPFYSTKGIGKGTGLGLATVYGIASQNGGFVEAESQLGEGATIRIYLPAEKAARKRTAGKLPEGLPTGHGECILLVEDEPILLAMTKTMLTRLNYTVLTARVPSEAIRLAQEHQEAIALIFSDVIMPETNGQELSQKLLAIIPEAKVLFMSGYTADVIAHKGVLDPEIAFIQKPFSTQAIAQKLQALLNS